MNLSADGCIYGALMLLLLPLKWILSAVAAAFFHELCHFLALRCFGVKIFRIEISSRGAVMETQTLSDFQELICALAGPAGSFLLAATVRYCPELAVCGLIHGIYNLLPIFPLDGGRAVGSMLGIFWPEKRSVLEKVICHVTAFSIMTAGLAAFFHYKLGVGVLVMTFLLIRKVLPRKIPCKDGRKRVQ